MFIMFNGATRQSIQQTSNKLRQIKKRQRIGKTENTTNVGVPANSSPKKISSLINS